MLLPINILSQGQQLTTNLTTIKVRLARMSIFLFQHLKTTCECLFRNKMIGLFIHLCLMTISV